MVRAQWLDFAHARVDWERLEETFPHHTAMRDCIQDPIHHAEGDVWTHTKMVADALPAFGFDNPIGRLTALFHDVEKPSTREVIDGRVTHHHHARKGAATAWLDLWKAGIPLDQRLAIYGLILWHQKVFHLWDYEDIDRQVQTFKAIGNWDDLIAFARADNRGRLCANPIVADDALELLKEYVEENNVDLDEASRFAYFRSDDRSPHYVAMPPKGSRVTIMSGLPGSGKDTHIRKEHEGKAIISLDAIRRELKIDPGKNQGPVVKAAMDQARVYLRKGEPFVWNALCVTKLQRRKIIGICADYDAHITIEAIDRPLDTILRQNRERDHADQMPVSVIERFIEKWEPPLAYEAHRIVWV